MRFVPSSKLVLEHEDWRERIYRHPYLVVLAAHNPGAFRCLWVGWC